MSKVFLLGANKVIDRSIPTVTVNQIVQMEGYDYDRYVVSAVTPSRFGINYTLINLRTGEYHHSTMIRPLSEKFGIGMYYNDTEPEFMDAMEVVLLKAKADRLKAQKVLDDEKAREESERLRAIGRERLEKLLPEDVQGLIVAEYRENESDIQTDYFGHSVGRRVILGYSLTKRNNFNELRKCAANFPETAHFTEHDPDHEDRRRYCLETHPNSGWAIQKHTRNTRENLIAQFSHAAGSEENIYLGKPAPAKADTAAAPIEATGVQMVDYSDKAVAVIGDTKPIKDTLSGLGGRFNFRLTYNGQPVCGWVFPKTKADEVRAALSI